MFEQINLRKGTGNLKLHRLSTMSQLGVPETKAFILEHPIAKLLKLRLPPGFDRNDATLESWIWIRPESRMLQMRSHHRSIARQQCPRPA